LAYLDVPCSQAKENHKVKEGEMSRTQAAKLHKEDRQIRRQERLTAAQNGTHIAKLEQKTLTQQISRQTGK
jgi:hypothetical protein